MLHRFWYSGQNVKVTTNDKIRVTFRKEFVISISFVLLPFIGNKVA